MSGIYGNVGQTNYGAAKQGIAGFTFIAAEYRPLRRDGQRDAPGALTRLTEDLGPDRGAEGGVLPALDRPAVHLAGEPAVGGRHRRVFESSGRMLAVAEGWHRGPTAKPVDDPTEVDAVMRGFAKARPPAGMDGQDLEGWEGR